MAKLIDESTGEAVEADPHGATALPVVVHAELFHVEVCNGALTLAADIEVWKRFITSLGAEIASLTEAQAKACRETVLH